MDSVKKARRQEEVADSIWIVRTRAAAFDKIQTFKEQKTAKSKSKNFYFEKGHLVDSNAIHLFLYLHGRDRYWGVYEVWRLENDNWKRALRFYNDGFSTQGVLFKDMNGDGYKDFVVERYGMAGTGEKYSNEVCLYNPHEYDFDYIEGLGSNPYFHAKKGIVTCYYNPLGVWTAEKYRLNWNKLELLEEIEIDIAGFGEGKCLRKIYRYRNGEKSLLKEDKVCGFPPEYKPYRELVKKQEAQR